MGWLSITPMAPAASAAALQCQTLSKWLCCLILHSLILLLCPRGRGVTQDTHVAGVQLCACWLWGHGNSSRGCTPAVSSAAAEPHPTALLLRVADLVRPKAVYAQAPEMESLLCLQPHPAKGLGAPAASTAQHRGAVPDLLLPWVTSVHRASSHWVTLVLLC